MSAPKIEEIKDDDKLDELISQWDKLRYVPKEGELLLPPQLSQHTEHKTPDEVMQELNRLPFFMTKLDESDGDGGENAELEALKQLAYDGEPDEIATNFKNQGNERYKARDFKNAIAYYTKGLDVDCGVDLITVALLINRAVCNLELKNYRKCIEDCKKALLIDEKNVKACFRAGKAFFRVGRYDEARQVLRYGLLVDPDNALLKQVLGEVDTKEAQEKAAKEKKEREAKLADMEQLILRNLIKLRHLEIVRTCEVPPALEGAKLRLEDPKDYQSQLIFPAIVLYPTIDEFDYVAEVSELTTPLELLEMLLDRPREWFDAHPGFTVKLLQVFMETTTGGLVKVGKKVAVNEAMMSDKPKAPLFDNALKLFVVPLADVDAWIAKWNKQAALAKRT